MIKIYSFITVIILFVSCDSLQKKPLKTDYSEYDPWKNPELPVDDRVKDLISRLTLEEKVSQMTNQSAAIPRLGIAEYDWWNECLHGVARGGKATVFPQAIALAATFDEELIFKVATAISDEGRAKYNAAQKLGNTERYMGLSYWTPNINIFRDPRWGRGQETYGEDPYLTSRMGVTLVKGLQGNNPDYLKTAACAKHFAVHSGPEAKRHQFNATPPKKDFVETYLPAFKALVKEAKVEAVMCAYNKTYDLPCCGSSYLLQDILRNDWGFKGHIVSDCGAIYDFYTGHNVVQTPAEAAAMALKAGVNVNCGEVYQHLKDAVDSGIVTEEEIDRELSWLLRSRFRLGLFDPPEIVPFSSVSEEIIHCDEHIRLSREAAIKSMVLLKNDGTLPLQKNLKDVQIIGVHGNDAQVLYGNYHGLSPDAVTIAEGIVSKLDPGIKVDFRQGVQLNRYNENKMDWSTGAAASADVVITVMGISNLLEGEEGASIASPSKGDRMDIRLPENQISYLKALRKRGNAPIILVVTGGSPVSLVDVEDLVNAILFIWYPGEQGGNAVADILFGDANPSGRLPVTFPKSVDQLPSFDDYSMTGRTYRYMKEEPEFTFGYGLSYTTYEYSNIRLSSDRIESSSSIEVMADIKNTGKTAGEEVVQLYITDMEASEITPLHALKGFQRLKLNPGETKTAIFTILPDMLELVTENGEIISEPGEFMIHVCGASPSPRSLALGSSKGVEAFFMLEE
ncbi:MAG: glycoside hydrolase family 3 C-terminal domain-containing protein [Bacteroidales bacterium]|nr:glycoside hydrolase family 3 C-terminal domain-containing protein [Bacteroidales bacterium]